MGTHLVDVFTKFVTARHTTNKTENIKIHAKARKRVTDNFFLGKNSPVSWLLKPAHDAAVGMNPAAEPMNYSLIRTYPPWVFSYIYIQMSS